MSSTVKFTDRLISTDGINYINMVLMLVSCVMAYMIPFELFLFAYAVLGPLHYLTEISWLQKKNYFIKSKWDIWPFIVVSILLLIGALDRSSKLNQIMTGMIFSSFMFALIIILVKKTTMKLLLLFASFFLFAIFGLNRMAAPQVIFAIFLPTIVHVLVFTGAFVLYGALKSKSFSGIFSFVFFIACSIVYFFYYPENMVYAIGDYTKNTYKLFAVLNKTLSDILGVGTINTMDDVFNNKGAIAIMRFIAFSYAYHYLNWFSKTSIIKWHEISRTRIITILLLWAFAIALYAFKYTVGFYALFFLSTMHVFLEFPLNHQTFIGIGKELKSYFKPQVKHN